MKLKNIILGLGLSVLGLFAQAQHLENIIVERYYVANAIDAAASVGTLPVGSVTYRVFADLTPGYTFQAAYGNSTHTLNVSTTTTFFNNEDRGATVPNAITKTQLAGNTVMLDSWVSVGSAGANLAGVLKYEDAAAGGTIVTHTGGVLANNDPQMGIPLTVQDGLWTGSVAAKTCMATSLLGLDLTVLDVPSQNGNILTANGGVWSAQGGAVGPTASNRVLIGQFTTDGTFHFDLNIQIGTPTNGTEKYVVSNANVANGEQVAAFCSQTFVAVPAAVTVNLTAPASASKGATVNVSASPVSTDGIDFVEFFVDGVSVGVDYSAPYEASFAAGIAEVTRVVKALAHSKQAVDAMAVANVQVGNAAPVVTVNSIAGPLEVGKSSNFDAFATDDVSVSTVEFFVGGSSIGMGTLTATPNTYRIAYTPTVTGSISITAKATDGDATPKSTTSAPVVVTVVANAGPVVTLAPITSPAPYGTAVTLSATATDVDGVSSVEFFDGANSLGMGTGTGPYTLTLPATLGLGSHSFTALAKDNATPKAQTTSAPVVVVITNPFPVVTLVSGTPNPVLQGAIVTLSATATDDGTVTVQFFNGTTLIPGTVVKTGNVYTLAYTPSFFGSISLIAKATDNLGQVTTSAPVAITVTPAGAYAIVRTSQVCNIESVCMPIKSLQSLTNVNGFNFSIKYDKAKVIPTGNITVSNDLIASLLPTGKNAEYITDYNTTIIDSANFGTINIAIYFNALAGANAKFAGAANSNVACVEFSKTPAFKSVDSTNFTFTEVIESYTDADAASKPANVDGKFVTFKDYTLSGSLKYWSDMSPIKYDAVHPVDYLITNISGNTKPATKVQPDLLGNFTYNVQNGLLIDIKRDINDTTNVHPVIGAQDSYLTALTSVKGTGKINWTPSVYQMIAMDVNRDKQITAGDATQINQRAVGLITSFNQNGDVKRDWSFVANSKVTSDLGYLKSVSFPEDDHLGYSKYKVPSVDLFQKAISGSQDTTCPLIDDEKYIGILLGDVDASYASMTTNHNGIKSAEAANGEIVFDLLQAVVVNGDLVIPVSLATSDVVNSFDFDVVLNDQKAVVKSVDGLGMNLDWNYTTSRKTLSVASWSLNEIPTQNSVTLTMTVSGTDALTLADFNATLVKINGKDATLKVVDASMAGFAGNTKENVVSIYPNPSSDVLNVTVGSNAKVQILDLNGKAIGAVRNVNANEKQVINVKNLAAGVYMVKIYNDKFVKTQRVVINK